MGLADLEVFIRERLRVFDENLDLSEGSPVDTQVIQPLLRRLGTDPFTVDASTFIIERLTQEFPDIASTDGDAVSDLLAKPALLLWDPLIREIQRIKNMLSFRDPATLTLDEAEALGANLFSERDRGNFSRGVARMYFAQAQQVSVTQANFFTSRSGLHFFPTDIQSARIEEILLNTEGELYYFDVNVVAEKAGDEYNISPSELVTVANIPAAIRVTNKNRFRFGLPEEDAVEFAGRIQQDLSERSLVTLRGIAAKLPRAFPEITRLAVVGFQDPEMQRDIITGGSLGPLLDANTDASAIADGEYKAFTRRVSIPSGTFLTTIGPAGPTSGFVLTLYNAFGAFPPLVRDLEITRVVSNTVLEVADQVVLPSATNKAWCLRKRELELSGIPGGILFPDSEAGTVAVEANKIHIGGCTDILVRGADFDTASLVLDVIADDDPILKGVELELATGPKLMELVLGTDYQVDDATYEALEKARLEQYTFEILSGVAAGVYRVLDVVQTIGQPAALTLDPTPLTPAGQFRWRLLDVIDIDLVEPKETRVTSTNGVTVQGEDTLTTSPAIDFDELGVSVGDILRLENGPDAGDFVVEALVAPFFSKVQVDRIFTGSQTGLKFSIFRKNIGGGVRRPLIRITGIDLLDSSSQPVGTKIPFAKPVEVRSRAFQNPGAGEKVAVTDAILGLVSVVEPGGGYTVGGSTVNFTWDSGPVVAVAFTAGNKTAAQVVTEINAASQSAAGVDLASVVVYNGQSYVGIIPVGKNTRLTSPSSPGYTSLFGDTTIRTCRDIRSASVADWDLVTPAIDFDLDTLWVIDGFQIGFYSDLERNYNPGGLGVSTALRVANDFSPEFARSIRVGARSLGSARVYFLEPTSMEIDQTTVFSMTDANGVELNFKPDPTLRFQKIPAPPNGTKPKNGVSTGANTLQSNGIDFVKKGVREGDILVVDFVPLIGSANLSDPVPNLALKDLRLSLDNQPDKIITFINDVATPNAVSRDGVADQINATVGLEICEVVEVSAGDFRLKFNPEMLLIVREQSASATEANTLVGFSNVTDTNNKSVNFGEYTVTNVTPSDTLVVNGTLLSEVDQQFKVLRRGGQRIVSTQMSENVAEADLYYWDVELVSEGVGDLWNIDAEQSMSVDSYKSDGYYLTAKDSNLTFSPIEDLTLRFSRSVLDVGVDDDPENATQLTGQSVSISYEYANLIGDVQNYSLSEIERVVNQSPLARHLVPHFVRFDLTYTGGSRESEVLPDVQRYIRDTLPNEALESSDIQKLVHDRGATSIQNPIDLLAVVYNFDRTVTLARSQNALTTGRLAAFIPDNITLTRRTT